ncbi:protein kinase domain-containing protein [Pseudofrankia sp. BMG5.37]|uniref:protein kinase domain-containing protein n=1 Tax=Pseudofrankia sp. BMG5.37 TaxID=3050035 RepID=UPI002895B369|nr:protein kinase [Pseudofrankia sp. BMG5.37]MDT3442754.1 protein kinase [Pseudofrankia sp. BMG5.37]
MGTVRWPRRRKTDKGGEGGEGPEFSRAPKAEPAAPARNATVLETAPAAPARRAASSSADARDVPAVWAVGHRILDLYEVRQVFESGGMGLVYRVHHLGWNVDLAVKSPRPELFAGEADRERFVREAETWVNLGVHPHLCACHYVRTLGGIPRVFAEYVDGGSLRDWIDDGRLYHGGAAESLGRVLDVAVQAAWGVEHAHGRGVVHQDLKPANILLDSEGTAKVTDFGLARSKGLAGGPRPSPAGVAATVLVTSGGLSPAYASPEQAAGEPVGRRSDVFSFAVTVLEMFTGEVTWLAGPAAGAALDDYRTRGPADPSRPSMPPQLADLLARCLADDPAARPGGMAEIAAEITDIYQRELGHVLPRTAPREAELRADELTNRALSMLDLDRVKQAEMLFDEALTADPQHLEATYNAGLLRWRAGRMTDSELVARLEAVLASAPDPGPVPRPLAQPHLKRGDVDVPPPVLKVPAEAARRALMQRLLAQVHLERGDVDSALPLLEEAARRAPEDTEVRAALRRARADGATGRRRRTLEGHTSAVSSVCVSADGRLALSGSHDDTVRVWDLATGRCLHVLEGHTEDVNSVCVTADGRRALSGGDDRTVRVWDLATGRRLRTFRGHTSTVNSVCVSADGRRALSGSDDRTVRVWKLATGRRLRTFSRRLRTFKGHTGDVNSVCVSADGRLALSGGDDRTVRVRKLSTGRRLHILEGHTSLVYSVCVTADGRLALSGGDDRTVRVWDLATGHCLHTLKGHTGGVNSVCVTADGRLALSGSDDRTVRVWDLATGHCLRTLQEHTGNVQSVCVSADGHIALSSSYSRTVRVWELPNVGADVASLQLCRLRPHAELVRHETQLETLLSAAELPTTEGRFPAALTLLRKARTIPGYERDPRALETWRRLSLFSVRTGVRGIWQSRIIDGHGNVTSVCVAADGRLALSSSLGNTVRVWELATGRCLHTLDNGHTFGIKSVCVSSDGRLALSSDNDSTVWVWDLATGSCLRILQGHAGEVNSVCVSADGRLALSGSHDNTVRVWELATGRCLHTLKGHTAILNGALKAVTSVCASPDGRVAVSGGKDCTVRVWDLATGRCLHTLKGHTFGVYSVCVSADGRFALSGSQDRTVRVWDLATGHCLHTLKGHTGIVYSVCVSADGRFALSGSQDRTVRVWDLATGHCLHTLTGHTSEVTSVCVSADGRLALSGSDDRTVRVWEIDWELEARDPADWDEGVRPHLETFLTLHTPVAGSLPPRGEVSEQQIRLGLSRRGRPSWTETDVDSLLRQLQYSGYGWIRPAGVKAELERMARNWEALPPLPGA